MTTEEEMTIDEPRKYLRKMKPRYIKAKRQERSQLLDEMEAITGLHRKSLGRVCKLQPMNGGGDDQHCPVVRSTLLIAGGQTAMLLHQADEPLHPVPLSTDRFVKRTASTLIWNTEES